MKFVSDHDLGSGTIPAAREPPSPPEDHFYWAWDRTPPMLASYVPGALLIKGPTGCGDPISCAEQSMTESMERTADELQRCWDGSGPCPSEWSVRSRARDACMAGIRVAGGLDTCSLGSGSHTPGCARRLFEGHEEDKCDPIVEEASIWTVLGVAETTMAASGACMACYYSGALCDECLHAGEEIQASSESKNDAEEVGSGLAHHVTKTYSQWKEGKI